MSRRAKTTGHPLTGPTALYTSGRAKRSSRKSTDSIYGNPGGSGPLIRAALLVVAVVVVLVLLAQNCTGSDDTQNDFEENVTTGVASVDENIGVSFDGETVTLTGEVATEDLTLQAETQARIFGATDVINEITWAPAGGDFRLADPEVAGALQSELDVIVEDNPILFETGSTTVAESSLPTLILVAEAINRAPAGDVTVLGYTDSVGEDERNLAISEERANAVRVLLVDSGVDALRVTHEGRGEADPIADNETAEGQATNRRIEFAVA